jgi:predicted RND superfamily exporter protein
LIAPRILIGIEEGLGPRPGDLGLMVRYKVGFTLVAIIAGVMVSMTVVMPMIGAVLFVIFLALFIWLPYRMTKRRNSKAVAKERPMVDEIKGAGHGFRAAGSVVHFLARWRVITVPAVVVLAVVGVFAAFRVESAFEFTDFLPKSSDPVVSLEKLEDHFGGVSGGSGYIYLEGDLTEPGTLAAMEGAIAEIDNSGAELTRDFMGDLDVAPNAALLVRAAVASPVAREQIATASGVEITDTDGNGLADGAAQVSAIYDYALASGIPNEAGITVLRPDRVQRFLYREGSVQGTLLQVGIPSWTDDKVIKDAWLALDDAAAGLRSSVGDEVPNISVSGNVITNKDTLDSFIESMLLSLPVAVLLAVIIAALMMRSIKYALISIVPILLVVAWVYGFMWLVNLKVNPITATIAAIAIGVGIDFATHFTVRFREEFVGEPSRFPALRRAGEGTGGALALSALTSILGFLALSLAPTPIFATFGILTAVMITFALLVSLLVLPSLLLLVTPSRKGEERERLIEAVTHGEYEYEPHARETAFRDEPSDD